METFIFLTLVGMFLLAAYYSLKLLLALYGKGEGLIRDLQLSVGHLYSYSKDYDKILADSLKGFLRGHNRVVRYTEYTIRFADGVSVWIGDKYVGYGVVLSTIAGVTKQKTRCSVATAKLLIEVEERVKLQKAGIYRKLNTKT